MSRVTRDGTSEPVSRDQILGHEREKEKLIFPVQLTTSRTGNLTWLILTLAICDDHTFIGFGSRIDVNEDLKITTGQEKLKYIYGVGSILHQQWKIQCIL